jgi:hypothetical protein
LEEERELPGCETKVRDEIEEREVAYYGFDIA